MHMNADLLGIMIKLVSGITGPVWRSMPSFQHGRTPSYGYSISYLLLYLTIAEFQSTPPRGGRRTINVSIFYVGNFSKASILLRLTIFAIQLISIEKRTVKIIAKGKAINLLSMNPTHAKAL